ncbi:MAG: hypothetical protein A4E19_15305 [Nitrospira sp. SG-bin1]|nr:MAG: hypothetical protein A4E19_15305 [Nitrospira sp. SG-bin1]
MSTAIDEIKAQIATKEAEMSRIDDELNVLRKALTILSGRRVAPETSNGGTHAEHKIPELIKTVLRDSKTGMLSTDELVSQVKAKGSHSTRQTILGSAYRMAKDPNPEVKSLGKGVFALNQFHGSTASLEDNSGVEQANSMNQ